MHNKFDELTKSMAQSVLRPPAKKSGFAFVLLLVTLLASQLTHAFTPTGSLQTARDGFTSTLLPDGKVLAAGGYDGTNYLAVAELYDPRAGTWAATGGMHSRRAWHTATLLPNGMVLVAGGYNGTNEVASAELYDPTTGAWNLTGSMAAARQVHSATLLPDGKVIVAGGYGLATAELYDPANRTWAATGSMTDSRAEHTATLLPNGKVLVVGGGGGGGVGGGSAGMFTAELYAPATMTWTLTGETSAPRADHIATLLPDGQVLVAGGAWSEPFLGIQSIAEAELYDPSTGTWADTSPLANSRYGHTATLLPNGRVLVTGGHKDQGFFGQYLSNGELYDPIARSWTSAGDMTVRRLYHQATLLSSGQVLIAAGNFVSCLSSAELYNPILSPPYPASQPVTLTDVRVLTNHSLQFGFTNAPAAKFSVMATTIPTLPLNYWMPIGNANEVAPGQFQFTDNWATNFNQRYYYVRWP